MDGPTAENFKMIAEQNIQRFVNFYRNWFADIKFPLSQGHLQATLDAINDGCKVTGHTTWSLMDDFEWFSGYTAHFGIYHVNFNVSDRKRSPRASVAVLRNIIETRRIPSHSLPPFVGICGQNYVTVPSSVQITTIRSTFSFFL